MIGKDRVYCLLTVASPILGNSWETLPPLYLTIKVRTEIAWLVN